MLELSISNLVITGINILVFYLLLRKFLYRPVMDIIEKRQALIEMQLANAKQTEENAMQLKEQYEQSLLDAREESMKIVEQAQDRAQKEYARIVQDADKKAEKLIAHAKKTVDQDREKAILGMKKEVAELAFSAVEKMLGETATSDVNQSLYGQFLAQEGEKYDTDRK